MKRRGRTSDSPARTRKEKIKRFSWNPEKKTCMSRSCKGWLQLFLYYVRFYVGIVIVAATFTYLCTHFRDYEEESRVNLPVIVTFRPILHYSRYGVFYYDLNDDEVIKQFTIEMDNFLKPYEQNSTDKMYCDETTDVPEGKFCEVDIQNWGPCTKGKGYGYKNGTPCIFLQLNKIPRWVPKFYDSLDDLPQDMPEDLIKYIKSDTNPGKSKLEKVWFSCEPVTPEDKEIAGSIRFTGDRGIPGYYFPFRSRQEYLSPLIPIQLENPKKSQAFRIECRAWAPNIQYVKVHTERAGSCMFSMQIY